MFDSLSFEIDESFLQPTKATTDTHSPGIGKRRKYDPTLFPRGQEIAARLNAEHRKKLALEVSRNPEAFKDFNISLEVKARAKSTPGAYKVLLSLIDIVLGPRGANITQEDCRATVQAMYPEMAVLKDWTKPLPTWAISHAKPKVLALSSPILVKNGMSLRDLHNAVRIAAVKANGEARSYRATIAVATDAIVINGVRFKVSVNKSNGREYAFVRLNVYALEAALKP